MGHFDVSQIHIAEHGRTIGTLSG